MTDVGELQSTQEAFSDGSADAERRIDTWSPWQAERAIKVLFKHAVDRPVDQAALAAFTAALTSGTHTLDMIFDEVFASGEARTMRLKRASEPLARELHLAVFGREPDALEILALVEGLETRSLNQTLSELLLSPEALRRQLRLIAERFGIAQVLLAQAEADCRVNRTP